MLRKCVRPARESVGVQDMAGLYPRDKFPEANICDSSTQRLRAGSQPKSCGYRLMASPSARDINVEGSERFSRQLMCSGVQRFPDGHVEESAKVINIVAVGGEC